MAKTGIPYYSIKKGNGFWEPNARMKLLGLRAVPCGPDGPGARSTALAWVARWEAMKAGTAKLADSEARQGYVYFVRLSTRVKIGFSGKPLTRIESLDTGLSERPLTFAAVRGSRADERFLHQRLAAFRQKGEWFVASAVVLRAMTRTIAFGSVERDVDMTNGDEKETDLSA